MIKKRLFAVAILAIFAILGSSVFSYGVRLNEKAPVLIIDVNATVEGEGGWIVSDVEMGSAEAELDFGKLTVEGADEGYLRFVCYPIGEEDGDAYTWLKSVFQSESDLFLPFYIYFQDEAGNRYPANGERIVLSAEGVGKASAIYSVSSDGVVSEVPCDADEDSISFRADGNEFYVVYGISEGEDPSVPPTGYFSDGIILWGFLAAVGGAGFLLTNKILRKY